MPLERFKSDSRLAGALVRRIRTLAGREYQFMTVCGTHTMAIARHGLAGLLRGAVRFLSGPGCPVCVTSQEDIDRAVAVAGLPGMIVATFGDMFRVSGSRGSLEKARAAGADVRIVYSPMDGLALAADNPGKEVVFLGVGFETTLPAVAATVRNAAARGIGNFSVMPLGKLLPPALRAILEHGEAAVDGFLMPGHVSAIIGSRPYEWVAGQFHVPCVITGFEPLDILQGTLMLLEQIGKKTAEVAIQYRRAVKPGGNPRALAILYEVFEPCAARWRAIGSMPGSGLNLKERYSACNAALRFPVVVEPASEPRGCRCGEVLLGLAEPGACSLFGTQCRPETAVGPCMVSSEGACAATYHYGEHDG